MKRLLDIVVSLMLLIGLSPLFLLICLLLYVENRGAVLQKTKCPGLHEVIFYMWRFKTVCYVMHEGVFVRKQTRVGQFLKRTGLDNLPQLINVLRGEMSLVGPRPRAMRSMPLERCEPLKKRHGMKPGIMGLAQVHGISSHNQKKQVELDHYYIKHQSFWLDLKIIYCSIKKYLKTALNRKKVEIDSYS